MSNTQQTEKEMREHLMKVARDIQNAHCTNFEPANRFHWLDYERKGKYQFSMDTRFASLDEIRNWKA